MGGEECPGRRDDRAPVSLDRRRAANSQGGSGEHGSALREIAARVKAALREMPGHMAAGGWTEPQARAWFAYLVAHGACTLHEAEALLDAYRHLRRERPVAPIVDLARRRLPDEDEQAEANA